MKLTSLKRDWEDLAATDPFWAVLSYPEKKFGKWQANEFFLQGERYVQEKMQELRLLGYPTSAEIALDFGAGLGRLTRAFARHFAKVTGLDISDRMVEEAIKLNSDVGNCEFLVYAPPPLPFPDDHFDFVHSHIVLQHLRSRAEIKSYIGEFCRVLKKSGVLVFQLPVFIPMRNRLQVRRRIYSFLRFFGLSPAFLHEKLLLHPVRMNFVPINEVHELLDDVGCRTLRITIDPCIRDFESATFFVTK